MGMASQRRAAIWSFWFGIPTGVVVAGAAGERPVSTGRGVLAVVVATGAVWVVSRSFVEDQPGRKVVLAALLGVCVAPLVALGVEWG